MQSPAEARDHFTPAVLRGQQIDAPRPLTRSIARKPLYAPKRAVVEVFASTGDRLGYLETTGLVSSAPSNLDSPSFEGGWPFGFGRSLAILAGASPAQQEDAGLALIAVAEDLSEQGSWSVDLDPVRRYITAGDFDKSPPIVGCSAAELRSRNAGRYFDIVPYEEPTYAGGVGNVTVLDPKTARDLPGAPFSLPIDEKGKTMYAWGYNGSGPGYFASAMLRELGFVRREREVLSNAAYDFVANLPTNEHLQLHAESLIDWATRSLREHAVSGITPTAPELGSVRGNSPVINAGMDR